MSLSFVRGIHRWPVNSRHKRPVARKMFPFGDVIFTAYIESDILVPRCQAQGLLLPCCQLCLPCQQSAVRSCRDDIVIQIDQYHMHSSLVWQIQHRGNMLNRLQDYITHVCHHYKFQLWFYMYKKLKRFLGMTTELNPWNVLPMITSWQGNDFPITGPLCGESIRHWLPA